MPLAAPATPRKMLPPPMTRQISTPSSWTDLISAAMRPTMVGSSPYSWSPINASPEILSKTRRYRAATDINASLLAASRTLAEGARSRARRRSPSASSTQCGGGPDHTSIRPLTLALNATDDSRGQTPSLAELRGDLGGEIRLVLLDAFAEREAGEPRHLDRLAELLRPGLDYLADAALAVDHEDLLEQHDLLVEFAQPALDHLLDDRFGLAARLGLLAQDVALAVERGFVDRGDVEELRIGCRDVHRQLLAERL